MSITVRSGTLLFAFIAISSGNPAAAATYYVDSIAGNDLNNGQAQTAVDRFKQGPGPWQNLAKVNTTLLAPGDSVLFKCGGVWDESLVVGSSGTSSKPIKFGTYGDCGSLQKPIFRRSLPVTKWVAVNGMWRAPINSDAWQVISYTGGKGALLPIARHPKITWHPADRAKISAGEIDMLRVQSAVTCGSLGYSTNADASCGLMSTRETLQSMQSLQGADVIIREGLYNFDRKRVLSQDSTTGKIIWTPSYGGTAATGLQGPAINTLQPGDGFFAVGLPWMIEEANEWAVERGSSLSLDLKLSSGTTPPEDPNAAGAIRITPLQSKETIGIDASGRSYLTFTDLQVVDAAVGLDATGSTGISVSGLHIARSAYVGARALSSSGFTMTNSTIEQSGFIGLSASNSINANVTGNQITDTGTSVPPSAPLALDLWKESNYYGIQMQYAENAKIRANRVAGSGYIGIRASSAFAPSAGDKTEIDGNTIEDTCFYLDDCSSIYTDGRNGLPSQVYITNNVVLRSTGNPIGRHLDQAAQTSGIALDDFANTVTVSGNAISDTGRAIGGHLIRNSSFLNNIFFASRDEDVLFGEDEPGNQRSVANGYASGNMCTDPYNCIVGNVVQANLFVGLPDVPAYYLLSTQGDTADYFADIGKNVGNQYANAFTGFLALDQSKWQDVPMRLNWSAWQTPSRDLSSSSLPNPASPYHLALHSGFAAEANAAVNGDFHMNTSWWSTWTPAGTNSLTVVTDGNNSQHGHFVAANTTADRPRLAMTVDGLTTTSGKSYVVRFAMRTDIAGFDVTPVLRNSQTNESIGAGLTVSPNGNWNTYYAVVTATQSVDAKSGQTVRLDFQIPGNSSIDITDVLVAEVSPRAVPARSLLHLFVGGQIGADGQLSSASFTCPDAGTPQNELCDYYLNLKTGNLVTWPLSLTTSPATNSSTISPKDSIATVTLDPSFRDSDGDGVADVDELCPATPAGVSVDERGCSYAQRHAPRAQ